MKETNFHPVPEWLTKDYLENVLRKYLQDNALKVIEIDIKPATAKGDNYASVMTRVRANYIPSKGKDIQEASLIVKTTYENDPYIANIFKSYQVSDTEMAMYEQILPRLTELLHKTGDSDKLFADTIYVDYKNTAIIFEDLAPLNYEVGDRLVGMDMKQAKQVLNKLAKMHATASVFNDRSNGVLEKFDHGIFNRHSNAFAPFFVNVVKVCADFAGNCKELGPYYKEKIEKLLPHFMEYTERACDPLDGQFNTLAHGDFWTNNIMLKCHQENGDKSKKTIQDLLLIDFQFCAWGSPAIDLHYFFNTSLQKDVRYNGQDELVQYYHQILVEVLQELKYQRHIPNLHEFCLQVEAGRFFAIVCALVSYPLMANDKTEDADFYALLEDDERARNFKKVLYDNKAVQENIKVLLPFFDRRGLLDIYK